MRKVEPVELTSRTKKAIDAYLWSLTREVEKESGDTFAEKLSEYKDRVDKEDLNSQGRYV